MSPSISRVRRLPAVQTCIAIVLSCRIRGKSVSGIATGPPLMWKDTSGCIASRWSAQMPDEPGIDDPPVWTVVIMPCFFAQPIIGT